MADFYPCASPNVTCFTPFINKMLNEGYTVHVVTSDVLGDSHPFEQENIYVHRVKDKKQGFHFRSLKKLQTIKNPIIKNWYKVYRYGIKACYELFYYKRSTERSYNGWSQKKVKAIVDTLLQEHDIQTVITVSHPFCTHEIGAAIKRKYAIDWYMLEYDTYGYNTFLFKSKKSESKKNKEKDYFNLADKILITPEIHNYYLQTEYNQFSNKFYVLEFANLIKHTKIKEINLLNKDKPNLFYAGAFNIHIRNPKNLLEFLQKINDEFLLTLVTKCDLSFVEDELLALGEKVVVLPRQEFEVVYYNELMSDILISIGNTISYQAPGKTFELMSTGKPIVHFKAIENDPVVRYLKDYPSVLIVDVNDKEAVVKFKQFITMKHKNYKYEEILSICNNYNPENILNNFIGLLEN